MYDSIGTKLFLKAVTAENAMENAKSTLGNEAKRSGYRYVMFFFDQVLLIVFFPVLGKYEVT